ncbi:MAG: hypothetical protein OP8BY_0185 [Candidatus Saccharicenans subterraneus]|uniref:Uncharacterized protein n=1 Tax=Candidatus Saccharicenans subterraneus TaxID=2508984 RepID=A0A3E2BLL9_9BACT|nr:MAG: hypothetical protein OP8BY_0185 [Candidatus Saccharicenans subterraneum]
MPRILIQLFTFVKLKDFSRELPPGHFSGNFRGKNEKGAFHYQAGILWPPLARRPLDLFSILS